MALITISSIPGGSTLGAELQNAVNTLVTAGGGIIDARNVGGTQAINSTVTIGDANIEILLGAVKINASVDAFGFAPVSVNNRTFRLRGVGSGTFLNVTAASARAVYQQPSAGFTIRLESLLIFHDAATLSSAYAIDLRGSGRLEAEHLTVLYFQRGVYIGGTLNATLMRDVIFTGLASDGVVQDTPGSDHSYTLVRGTNRLKTDSPNPDPNNPHGANTGSGFLWLNGNGVWMTDCEYNKYGVGVGITPSSGGKTTEFGYFKGVTCDSCFNNGWSLESTTGLASQLQFVDCWGQGNVNNGMRIALSTNSQPAINISVIGGKYTGNGNFVQNNGGCGILLEVGKSVYIGAGVQCRGNVGAGIVVGSNAQDFTINGAMCTSGYGGAVRGGNQSWGIYFATPNNRDHFIITDNFLRGNTAGATNGFPAPLTPSSSVVADNLLV